MELLTEDEIAGRLGGVPGWTREGSSITTTITRDDLGSPLTGNRPMLSSMKLAIPFSPLSAESCSITD